MRKQLVGDDIMCAEMVPFSFSHKDGGEIKPAAMPKLVDESPRSGTKRRRAHRNKVYM